MDEKTILLVEDNPRDVDLTKRALEKANIANRIVVAEDGVDALRYLYGDETCPECPVEELPVLVLMDLKLPRIDGLEVLRKIRTEEKTKFLPVVILTTSSEQTDVIQSYNLGANSFIRKPVKFSEFAEAIRQVGLYWLVMNQTAPTNRSVI